MRSQERGFIGRLWSGPFGSANAKALAGDALIKEIVIDAPPHVIFPYFLDPTKIIRWMGIRAEIDPRHGGKYRLQLNTREVILGEYLEIVPDTRLVFTWGWERPRRNVSRGSTRVEIELCPVGGGTRIRLSHGELTFHSDC